MKRCKNIILTWPLTNGGGKPDCGKGFRHEHFIDCGEISLENYLLWITDDGMNAKKTELSIMGREIKDLEEYVHFLETVLDHLSAVYIGDEKRKDYFCEPRSGSVWTIYRENM